MGYSASLDVTEVMPPSSPLRMDMRSMSKDDLKYVDSTILVQLKRCMQRHSVIPSSSRHRFSRQQPLMDPDDALATRRCSYIYHVEGDGGTGVVAGSKDADTRGLLMLMICYFYSIMLFFMAAFIAYFFISIKRRVMLELALLARRLTILPSKFDSPTKRYIGER